MPVCYLCDRLRREGADVFPAGRDKTGRPVIGAVYGNSLRYIRHVCDAPTQGERANTRREAAAELQMLLTTLYAAATLDAPADASFRRALDLVETIRTLA